MRSVLLLVVCSNLLAVGRRVVLLRTPTPHMCLITSSPPFFSDGHLPGCIWGHCPPPRCRVVFCLLLFSCLLLFFSFSFACLVLNLFSGQVSDCICSNTSIPQVPVVFACEFGALKIASFFVGKKSVKTPSVSSSPEGHGFIASSDFPCNLAILNRDALCLFPLKPLLAWPR